jgi:putative two-component system response regulator
MGDTDFSSARILVVDDMKMNVALLERILTRAGYRRLRGVTDPRLVVEVYDEFRPDLILLDLHMPHLDGFAVMDQLRSRLDGVYMPILVVTGDPAPEVKRRALSAGARDFLTKPFDRVEVELRIRNVLEARFLYLELERIRAGRRATG